MSWTQASQGRWKRPLDGFEGYHVSVGHLAASQGSSVHHYTAISKVQLEWTSSPRSADLQSRLREAWVQLRYEQPSLATTVEGMTKVYQVPDESEIQAWLDKCFVVSSDLTADDVYRAVPPLGQAVLYYLPRSSELALRAPMHVIDGIGMLMFWDRYLDVVTGLTKKDISFGDEPRRLAPSLGGALGALYPPTQEQEEETLEILKEYMKRVSERPKTKSNAHTHDHNNRDSKSQSEEMPEKCRGMIMVFSSQATRALIHACKAKGLSVTSAVHAAFIQTLLSVLEASSNPFIQDDTYVCWLKFNLRKYLPKPYSTSQYAASLYYAPFPWNLEVPVSFADTVRALNYSYKSTYDDDPQFVRTLPYLTRLGLNTAEASFATDFQIPRRPMFNSLGILEQYIKHKYSSNGEDNTEDLSVTIRDVRVQFDVHIGQADFQVSTFRDQMRIGYFFNEGHIKLDDVNTFLDSVKGILEREMLDGVEIDAVKSVV